MPIRTELRDTFNTSVATIQRALDQLMADGFVVARGKLGTFVSDLPPHLCTYGIALPRAHSHFMESLGTEGSRIAQERGLNVRVYQSVEPHVDNPAYCELMDDCRAHRLAGVVFGAPPTGMMHAPKIDVPELAQVAVSSTNESKSNIPIVMTDGQAFFDTAVEHLVQRNCRRLAVMACGWQADSQSFDQLARAVSNAGLSLPGHRLLCVPLTRRHWARNVAQALMLESRNQRPDALIITDDHLIENAALGLADAGISVPRDIEVVAHTNFPVTQNSRLSFSRLGYDVQTILRECFDVLARQKEGRETPHVTMVRPILKAVDSRHPEPAL